MPTLSGRDCLDDGLGTLNASIMKGSQPESTFGWTACGVVEATFALSWSAGVGLGVGLGGAFGRSGLGDYLDRHVFLRPNG